MIHINNIRYINFTYDKSYDTIIGENVQERNVIHAQKCKCSDPFGSEGLPIIGQKRAITFTKGVFP